MGLRQTKRVKVYDALNTSIRIRVNKLYYTLDLTTYEVNTYKSIKALISVLNRPGSCQGTDYIGFWQVYYQMSKDKAYIFDNYLVIGRVSHLYSTMYKGKKPKPVINTR